jgi:AcrR family transcriptional regulator/predicted DNA-binding transcriptional regulator AlpA
MSDLLKIAELEKVTGIPRTTIHYYQREGLLPPAHGEGRTVAFYGDEHLRRLQEIKRMREEELLPLKEIKRRISPDGVKARPAEPASARGEATRRRILEAAVREFSQNGYRRTKVTDIISSLGIATMTFYRYFPNKRQLFLEVVDSIVNDMIEHVETEIAGEADFIIRMLKRAQSFYVVYSQNQDILQILHGEAAGSDPELSDFAKRIYQRLVRDIVADIEEWRKEGILKDFDPEFTAYLFLGASQLVSYRMSMDDRYSVHDFLSEALNLLLAIKLLPMIDLNPLREPYESLVDELARTALQRGD